MPGSTDGTAWIGCPEAARQLGIGLRTLYRIFDNGDLPAYRIGRVIRLRRSEVDEWVASRQITPGTIESRRRKHNGQ